MQRGRFYRRRSRVLKKMDGDCLWLKLAKKHEYLLKCVQCAITNLHVS